MVRIILPRTMTILKDLNLLPITLKLESLALKDILYPKSIVSDVISGNTEAYQYKIKD